MKVKHSQCNHHHHHHHHQQTAAESSANMQISNEPHSAGAHSASAVDHYDHYPLSQSPTIQTRSAAFRARHQKPPTSSNLKHSNHIQHNHQHQLAGKIVKPIPVRPVSSSASSTHSSSAFSASIANYISNSLFKPNETFSAASSAATAANNEFSLIAKYFASFPATRLKATTTTLNEHRPNNSSSSSCSPILATNETTTSNNSKQRNTPFLPFKKPSASFCAQDSSVQLQNSYISNNTLTDVNCAEYTTTGEQFDPSAATEHHPYNLRHYSQSHTTEHHLCSNFKRMIKLNDLATAQTVSTDESAANQYLHHHHHHQAVVATWSPHLAAATNHANSLATCGGAAGIEDHLAGRSNTDDEFAMPLLPVMCHGQITMETRSTRKFLIKHHPYLQMHHKQQQQLEQQYQLPRPSMNLIKMKKLINKANRKLAKQLEQQQGKHMSPALFNLSGRLAVKNTSSKQQAVNREVMTSAADVFGSSSFEHMPIESGGHQQLLKFTDLAPVQSSASSNNRPSVAGGIANSLRNARQRSMVKTQLHSNSASKIAAACGSGVRTPKTRYAFCFHFVGLQLILKFLSLTNLKK